MKRLFIAAVMLFLSLQSCRENKIEIIPDYDNDYLTLEKVDEPVSLKNMEQEQKKLFVILKDTVNNADSKYNVLFEYRLYISANGKIERIRILNSEVKELEQSILGQLGEWSFNPAKLNGQSVKFRFDLKISPESLSDKKLISDFFNENKYFIAVNQMPEPIGGITAIQKNIIYPESAKKEGIQGRVYVKAYIDEQGDVSKVDLIKGIGADCDESAMAAVKKTKFKPGMQNGKPVKVQVAVPILFELK